MIDFKDDKHKEAFRDFIIADGIHMRDKERLSLFYVLSMYYDTRNNIYDLYNFEDKCILIDGLNKGWQTGTTTKATKLAFNLFNNYIGEGHDDYSPLELFNTIDKEYYFEAVRIRFGDVIVEKEDYNR